MVMSLNEVRPGRPEQFALVAVPAADAQEVSMKSGLEDRNNRVHAETRNAGRCVSMKSGLEDRNNGTPRMLTPESRPGLNEVRPGRPEQWQPGRYSHFGSSRVSMKSGLEDRNNKTRLVGFNCRKYGLNEVRPGRPEQSESGGRREAWGCPVSMKSGLEDRNNHPRTSS